MTSTGNIPSERVASLRQYLVPLHLCSRGVDCRAMTHDEKVHKDPHNFQPEHFLNEDGKPNDDDRVSAYGFGRRFCVGEYVTSSTMWVIASTLACFNIGKVKDDYGRSRVR
ncbi:unnamed protein product [Cyclocybe aegerita]|uniref:Cytochrome P450 n=1 Tax=Cyclocybe aegerita TaxID=1973307 RepID=A0A8S0XI43_CYCAE|nr:unnamed protein product [Cyclocybe aegerita]